MKVITDDSHALIARLAAGDRAALRELYDRHSAALAAFVSRYTSDRGEIEEIVQDTMLAAWHGAGRFAGRSSVRSWLFGIARRRAADIHRRWRPEIADAALETLSDPAPGPEAWALAQAGEDELLAAIERLSPIHREVLELVFVHHFAYAEVAETLDIPLGTVKSRLNHARKALRAHVRSDAR